MATPREFLTKGGTTKRIGPLPKIPRAPKKTTTTTTTKRTTSKPKTSTPYDPFHIPTLAEMKAQATERQNQYTQTGLAALPTEAAVRAPYDRQSQDVQGLTQALVGMLGKLQTQQQQIGTGQVQALATDQARLQPSPQLAADSSGSQAVLAALGTSAPNIMAANQAAAGASGAIYGRGIAQRATDAVSARTQEAAAIKGKALEAYSKHLDDLQQRAFQTGVAKQNYALASGESQFDQTLKTTQVTQDATTAAAKLAETTRHNRAAEKIALQKATTAAAKATAAGNPKQAAALKKASLAAIKDAYKELSVVKPKTSSGDKQIGVKLLTNVGTEDFPSWKDVVYKVGANGEPVVPPNTVTRGIARPATDTVTTTTKGDYWPAFKKARAVLQAANATYGFGWTPAVMTQMLQQYAASPSTKPKPAAPTFKVPGAF